MILSNSHTIIFWINLSVKGAGFKLLSVECREKVYFLWALLASNLLASNLLKILAVCIYWSVCCLRIHLLESYWAVLSNYPKIMVSLSYIFCWGKHIFLIIIQIFTKKHFSFNFWTTDPLNIVDPSFVSFLRDLHTDDTLVANKYTKNIKWVE